VIFPRLAAWALFCRALGNCAAPAPQSAAELSTELRQISVDENRIYRVRDLVLTRGDIKLYLNEGILGFFKPIGGRTVAAIFTTEQTEFGDAEAILLPPTRGERQSLSAFTKSPNLNEHFGSALLVFSDDTDKEVSDQIGETPVHAVSDVAGSLATGGNRIARQMIGQLDIRLLQSLLDNHVPSEGFFYALIGTRHFGPIDLSYEPSQAESVSVGAMASEDQSPPRFQTWANFRPRRSPPLPALPIRIKDYRIETEFLPELALSATAQLTWKSAAADGRTVPLELSPHLKVESATIDGIAAEVVQHGQESLSVPGSVQLFLLVAPRTLTPDTEHSISIHYRGSIVRKSRRGDLFVDDRNAWYPVSGFVLSQFDLFFHCPERLKLVSTGELVSDEVEHGVRTVHRRTSVPEGFAGFNLGEYSMRSLRRAPYTVDVYSENAADVSADPDLPARTAEILLDYTNRWMPLPIHTISVSPIAGYFGQGFPGLIYLSNVSYVKQENRPPQLRNPRMDAFFSDLLLPHEIAHQWWGNIVRSYDYRSDWLNEAMANDSALQYLKETKGIGARDSVLDGYREDLVRTINDKQTESAGPIEFGERLIDTHDMLTWHVITYEKGAWILEMLRQRVGEENFRKLQLRLLHEYATKPISNEELRAAASSFLAQNEPDHTLAAFFDTWIYGTGIPHIRLHGREKSVTLEISGVDEDFIADVPLRCRTAESKGVTHWLRAGFGKTTLELSKGLAGCELPSRHLFLYVPEK
jgi:hypothetical protein